MLSVTKCYPLLGTFDCWTDSRRFVPRHAILLSLTEILACCTYYYTPLIFAPSSWAETLPPAILNMMKLPSGMHHMKT